MLVLFDVTCIAFLLSLILTPYVRDTAKRFGWVDQPDHERKLHAAPIPRLGGVAVVLAYVLALAVEVLVPYRNLSFDIPTAMRGAIALAPAAAIVFLVGLVDDLMGLKPWQKLIGEAVAAVIAWHGGFGVHALGGAELPDWVSFAVTVAWLVGCANALNLIDGMDGLAAGVGLFSTLTMVVAALVHDSVDLAIAVAPLAGALLGFLRYNFNPASVFLGDCGSLTVGFLLGCFGAAWSQKSATVLGMTAPLIALAMPLLDTGLAIIRRGLRGQGIFSPDRGHIHHRLLEQGLTPRRAALVLYAICGLAAALSLLQDFGQNRFGGLIILLFCLGAWMGVQHLGYAEFGMASRVLLRGTLRGMVQVQIQLQTFERQLFEQQEMDQAWPVMLEGMRKFGLSGLRVRVRDRSFGQVDCEEKDGVWQLRVPLAEGEYVNLYHDHAQELHPIVLNQFPKILEKYLLERHVRSGVGEKAQV